MQKEIKEIINLSEKMNLESNINDIPIVIVNSNTEMYKSKEFEDIATEELFCSVKDIDNDEEIVKIQNEIKNRLDEVERENFEKSSIPLDKRCIVRKEMPNMSGLIKNDNKTRMVFVGCNPIKSPVNDKLSYAFTGYTQMLIGKIK